MVLVPLPKSLEEISRSAVAAVGLMLVIRTVLAQEWDGCGDDPQINLVMKPLRLSKTQAKTPSRPSNEKTSGLPTIDCYLSGEALEPPAAEEHYTERLVALPHLGCYLERLPFTAAAVDPARSGIDPRVPLLICPGVP